MSRRALRIAAGVAILVVFAAGCSAVVGQAIWRGGRTRPDPAADGTYSIDYRCAVRDGVMSARGTLGNAEDHDRRLQLSFVVVPEGGTTVVARSSFKVGVAALSTAEFDYPLIDPSVRPDAVTLDDETCVLVGVFEV